MSHSGCVLVKALRLALGRRWDEHGVVLSHKEFTVQGEGTSAQIIGI